MVTWAWSLSAFPVSTNLTFLYLVLWYLTSVGVAQTLEEPETLEHHVRHMRHHFERQEQQRSTAGPRHATALHALQFDDKLTDVEVGGPQCPPSVRPVSSALCEVRKCFSHAECRPEVSTPRAAGEQGATPELERLLQRRACCYNGCVYSCMHRMPPPAVFDWLEETPDYVSNSGNSSAEESDSWPEHWTSRQHGMDGDDTDDTTAAHVAPPDVVALAGGCVLTHSEYLDFQKFQKSKYIEKCYCKHGEVFCKVQHSSSKVTEAEH